MWRCVVLLPSVEQLISTSLCIPPPSPPALVAGRGAQAGWIPSVHRFWDENRRPCPRSVDLRARPGGELPRPRFVGPLQSVPSKTTWLCQLRFLFTDGESMQRKPARAPGVGCVPFLSALSLCPHPPFALSAIPDVLLFWVLSHWSC